MIAKPNSAYILILISISIIAVLFQLLILFNFIPFDIIWGGKLKTQSQIYILSIISILINCFFIFILLQKGRFLHQFLNDKSVSITLWIFFVYFILNTFGNLLAENKIERFFSILTLINAILIYKINKNN